MIIKFIGHLHLGKNIFNFSIKLSPSMANHNRIQSITTIFLRFRLRNNTSNKSNKNKQQNETFHIQKSNINHYKNSIIPIFLRNLIVYLKMIQCILSMDV